MHQAQSTERLRIVTARPRLREDKRLDLAFQYTSESRQPLLQTAALGVAAHTAADGD